MGKVLQLESGKLFKSYLKLIVETRGFEHVSVETISEAFEILEKSEVDIIVTANQLQDGTGEEFLGRLNKTEYASIPVIILTSTESLELREKLFSLGIVDYILKKDMTVKRLENYFDTLLRQDTILKKIQKERIAVLDDSRLELTLISNIFKLNKIDNVEYYSDPAEFLKNAEKFSFYFIDMVLPGYSGEEIIVQLRQKNKNCVIIVVSGISNFKIISHAIMHGADDYITKPFDNAVFMARLKANARSFFLYKEIEKMAVTDSLTGLYNHKYICDLVYNMARMESSRKTPFSIVLFDIDHFKSVNDTYGHQIGDYVLSAVANLLKSEFRENCACGRYGGEEFLAVMKNCTLGKAFNAAQRFREKVASIKFKNHDFSITISGGTAQFKGESGSDLIKKADNFLYTAKKEGRNRIIYK